MARWSWHLRRTVGALWFRASVFGIIAVLTALLAYYFKDVIPEDVSQKIGADAVDSLLNIIASSMLAVTTFSLTSMVGAYSAATTSVTPRSTKLLLEDKTSHTVLSTFLGAFIYSLVGIIALRIGLYGSSGRLILFVVTILVIAVVIVTLIRWIEYLSRLGRVGDTIDLVEKVTTAAMKERIKNPYLGGSKLESDAVIPQGARPLTLPETGYVQFIDMETLSAIAAEQQGKIYILSLPGTFSTPNRPCAWVEGIDMDEFGTKLVKAFVVAGDRSFEQDPRFGMIVLSEIASRALSPAVNDPGTAIDVIGTSVRILSLWHGKEEHRNDGPEYPLVYVSPLNYQDLFEDVFLPIARDGAGVREIAIPLQKGMIALSAFGDDAFREAARQCSQRMLVHAKRGLGQSEDYESVCGLAAQMEARR